jgi:hypothetical protein
MKSMVCVFALYHLSTKLEQKHHGHILKVTPLGYVYLCKLSIYTAKINIFTSLSDHCIRLGQESRLIGSYSQQQLYHEPNKNPTKSISAPQYLAILNQNCWAEVKAKRPFPRQKEMYKEMISLVY